MLLIIPALAQSKAPETYLVRPRGGESKATGTSARMLQRRVRNFVQGEQDRVVSVELSDRSRSKRSLNVEH